MDLESVEIDANAQHNVYRHAQQVKIHTVWYVVSCCCSYFKAKDCKWGKLGAKIYVM